MARSPKKSELQKAMAQTRGTKQRVPEATDYDTGAGDDPFTRPATARVVDFAAAARQPDPRRHGRIIDERDEDSEGKLLTPKRIRARARRRATKGQKLVREAELALWKPIEEWDMEELARGRPRAADGSFSGRPPGYISRQLHEQAMDNFKKLVRAEMRGHTVDALTVLSALLNNTDEDNKGKPVVPASTKLDAAKFLIEHVVGKAVQPTSTDISVKLQAILGTAVVNPDLDSGQYKPAHVAQILPAEESHTDVYDDGEVQDAEVVWDDDE